MGAECDTMRGLALCAGSAARMIAAVANVGNAAAYPGNGVVSVMTR